MMIKSFKTPDDVAKKVTEGASVGGDYLFIRT